MAFSCKRRGICPSCGTRRMDEAAAHLVDHVIPKVPVRQWVLSFPIPLRSSAANLNIHLHAWCSKPSVTDTIDTAHECPPVPAAPIFHPAGAPTHAALQSLLGKIITRILRLLTRLGHLVEEEGETYLAGGVTDPDDVMTPLQAAAANYRIAQGPRAGQKVLSLQLAPRRPARGGESSALCANAHGFTACMQTYAARPRTGKGWSNYAAISPATM